MNTHGNDRKEVLSTVNAVLPSIMNDPEKYNVENKGSELNPVYPQSGIVNKAFEIALKVQEELDKRTI